MQKIYQYYLADRKEKKQDYTPASLAQFTFTRGQKWSRIKLKFEDGGGYRIYFGNDGYLQYHPNKGHHHKGAYWKIGNGQKGMRRYNLDGTPKYD